MFNDIKEHDDIHLPKSRQYIFVRHTGENVQGPLPTKISGVFDNFYSGDIVVEPSFLKKETIRASYLEETSGRVEFSNKFYSQRKFPP